MKLRRTKHWFIVILAYIALSSALLFFFLQNPLVNNYHPPYRTMWQAYYWFADTPFGSLGMDDWRLEGVDTMTAIEFGKFHYYDIPLSAPAVAAIGFAGITTLGLLCFTFFLRRSRQPPNKSPEPTAVGACSLPRKLSGFPMVIAVHVASRRWLSFFR
jgi:hypothetical protein